MPKKPDSKLLRAARAQKKAKRETKSSDVFLHLEKSEVFHCFADCPRLTSVGERAEREEIRGRCAENSARRGKQAKGD
eukprot:9176084-Alexandrium_andersonii.AAC.1